MLNNICIRNAKYALTGLKDMIDYINDHSDIPTEAMTMVEIGSYVGDSTRIFAQNFGQVFSVDPYKNGYDPSDTSSYKHPMNEVFAQFKREILDKFKNVTHLKNTSKEAAKVIVSHSDFVYIDGNHQLKAVEEDINLWLPKIKKGGWIGGHDYNRVNSVVDKLIKPDMTFNDTSWIKRII
jgi:hypothetical protein